LTPLRLMYLTYLDDSGSDRKSPVVLVGAVLIKDPDIRKLEAIGAIAVEQFIPEGKWPSFKEFHAAELFHGHQVFEGVDISVRHEAIEVMFRQMMELDIPCIYSAVRKAVFEKGVIGSVSPIDVAFRMCALGVQHYLVEKNQDETALFLFDDTQDGKLKLQLQASFRGLRPRMIPPYWEGPHRMFNIHDAMYFGSSRDSIGIQMADLCSYFILRKLKGEQDALYENLKENIICAKIEPDWSTYKHIFVEHTD
jgi:Protein of unknown function (DUF3800)